MDCFEELIIQEEQFFNFVDIPPYLVNEHYGDRYFDVIDAFEEAKHIFFQGNNILERLLANSQNEPFIIGETGFGAGRNLVSLLDSLEASGLQNLSIIYNSVELHPLPAERMSLILEGFREKAGHLIDQLVQAYESLDLKQVGWQQLTLHRPFGTVTLNLLIGEALEMVQALSSPCDAWFLDGHGPRKNPLMWRSELLDEIGLKTKSGGTFATFTVAVAVSRALTEAGFRVEQFPGLGRKRAVLRGVKV